MNTNKMLAIGVIIIVILIIYKRSKANENTNTAPLNNSNSGSNNVTVSVNHTADTILKKGDKGPMVQQLQIEINKRLLANHAKLTIDGVFGDKTLAALQYLYGEKVTKASVNMIKNTPTWTAPYL